MKLSSIAAYSLTCLLLIEQLDLEQRVSDNTPHYLRPHGGVRRRVRDNDDVRPLRSQYYVLGQVTNNRLVPSRGFHHGTPVKGAFLCNLQVKSSGLKKRSEIVSHVLSWGF